MTADLTLEFTVAASPDDVFAAICDVAGWWGPITGRTDAVGEEFVYVVPGLHYSGFRVSALEPGRVVEWIVTGSYLDFISDRQEWNGTVVRFEIDETPEGTRVVFAHRGLNPDVECYAACSNAWALYVRGSLPALIETGVGTPNLFDADGELDEEAHARLRDRIEGAGAAILDADAAVQS